MTWPWEGDPSARVLIEGEDDQTTATVWWGYNGGQGPTMLTYKPGSAAIVDGAFDDVAPYEPPEDP